ncbi:MULTISPECIES: hypothetical protein [Xenorhabdus]|uniref:hypothetical protein n=1 Tax=Xenorhabdus TaxID=626 RepID=UPI000689C37A|nr:MULTISPECIES: hypothetical protein [Xenorhabdus]
MKPKATWNDLSEINAMSKATGTFEGDIKVDNNIPHIKSIPAPFPKSELNKEHYNARPKKTLIQKILTKSDDKDTGIGVA